MITASGSRGKAGRGRRAISGSPPHPRGPARQPRPPNPPSAMRGSSPPIIGGRDGRCLACAAPEYAESGMATVEIGSGCSGSPQHSSNLNNTYDVPWTVFLHEGSVCVRFQNPGSTHASVNTWVEDTAGNGPLSDTGFSVQVPPGGETSVVFSDFGTQADQTTPISECILHTVVHNDDSENTGVELYHEVY